MRVEDVGPNTIRKACPQCGTPNGFEAALCTQCGASLPWHDGMEEGRQAAASTFPSVVDTQPHVRRTPPVPVMPSSELVPPIVMPKEEA